MPSAGRAGKYQRAISSHRSFTADHLFGRIPKTHMAGSGIKRIFRLFVPPDSEVVCFNRGSNLSDKKRFLHHLYTHNGSYLFLFEKICCYTGRQDDEPVEEILFAVWSRPVFFIIFSIMSPLSIPIGCIADQK